MSAERWCAERVAAAAAAAGESAALLFELSIARDLVGIGLPGSTFPGGLGLGLRTTGDDAMVRGECLGRPPGKRGAK